MKVQVLKEVDAANAINHSLAKEDNHYFATVNGLGGTEAGQIVEVYRDPNSELDDPAYLNEADNVEVNGYCISILRQLINLDIAAPAQPEPPSMEQVILIKQFRAQTGLGLLEAKHWLSISGWDYETALNKFTHRKG